MEWQKEVQQWIECLQDEVDGVCYLIQKINNAEKTSGVGTKLIRIAELLKQSMKSLIKKCENSLKSKNRQENKVQELRNEYFRTMQNAENLHSTANSSNLKPHYVFSTYASRKRSLSRPKIIERPESSFSQRLFSETPKKLNKKTKKNSYTNVKEKLSPIKQKISSHQHPDYENALKTLQEENLKLKKKIVFLREETRENFKYIEDLKSRLEQIESRTPSDNTIKSRFLLKSPNN